MWSCGLCPCADRRRAVRCYQEAVPKLIHGSILVVGKLWQQFPLVPPIPLVATLLQSRDAAAASQCLGPINFRSSSKKTVTFVWTETEREGRSASLGGTRAQLLSDGEINKPAPGGKKNK
jgi:hypothetical protein